MILTIDVGNTNTVLGIYDQEKLTFDWRISTDQEKTADEYGILFKQFFIFADLSLDKIKGIIISSTVPPTITTLEKMAQQYFHIKPLIIGPGVKTGMNIRMDNPLEVGADRIVNAVGAYQQYGGPLIIVDFGTATTFDAVSAEGEYVGGAIAPGIGISTEALFAHAAKLPRIELKRPEYAIGKNTIMGMQSGIIFGFVGQVELLISKFKEELGEESKVIATGGLVNLVAAETDAIDIVAPFLTLEGLYYIGRLNGFRE